MIQRVALICALCLALLQVSDLRSETYLVPDDYDTIQEAVDVAEDGDVIEVEAGTYTENIDLSDKVITLRSRGDATNTTIDGVDATLGSDMASVLTFDGTGGVGATIEGFTLTNGSGSNYTYDLTGTTFDGGGAVFCVGATVTMRGCVLDDNLNGGIHAREDSVFTMVDCTVSNNVGAGITVLIDSELTLTDCVIAGNGNYGFETGGVSTGSSCSVTIDRCTFEDNGGFVGGGASLQADAQITNSIFLNNNASFAGALFIGEDGVVEDCQFIENSAGIAAGALSEGGSLFRYCLFAGNDSDEFGAAVASESMGDPIEVIHCTIVDNTALVGAAVWISETPVPSDVEFELRNCIVWDNEGEPFEAGDSTISAEYSNIESGYDGVGNIDDDPDFVDADSRDYRLLIDSPCIDTGDPTLLDPDGSVADMGMFPYVPLFTRGDIDGNGVVSALVDSLRLFDWAFGSGPSIDCRAAADVDDNGSVSALLDSLYLLRWAFAGGEEPPTPGPYDCEQDGTPDDIGCEIPPDCS